MGKNKRKSGKFVQKRDVFQRLNYLYQASHFALTLQPPNADLARFYMKTMKTLAMKNVVRLNPHIKRTICKKCNMLLLPGITSTVRKKASKGRHIVVKCLECGMMKRFLPNPEHQLWNDKPENIAEVITLGF